MPIPEHPPRSRTWVRPTPAGPEPDGQWAEQFLRVVESVEDTLLALGDDGSSPADEQRAGEVIWIHSGSLRHAGLLTEDVTPSLEIGETDLLAMVEAAEKVTPIGAGARWSAGEGPGAEEFLRMVEAAEKVTPIDRASATAGEPTGSRTEATGQSGPAASPNAGEGPDWEGWQEYVQMLEAIRSLAWQEQETVPPSAEWATHESLLSMVDSGSHADPAHQPASADEMDPGAEEFLQMVETAQKVSPITRLRPKRRGL